MNNHTVKTSSKILWLGMQANAPILIVVVFIMHRLLQLEEFGPELKNIIIGLSVFSVLTPFFILGHFKRKQREISDNIKLDMDNPAEDLQRYITFLVIGMSLCSLPAVLGLVLYILVKEINLAIFFICVSFFLGFLFKPDLT